MRELIPARSITRGVCVSRKKVQLNNREFWYLNFFKIYFLEISIKKLIWTVFLGGGRLQMKIK